MRLPAVLLVILISVLIGTMPLAASSAGAASGATFPPTLESYDDAHLASLWEVLVHRVSVQPFNLWATVIFVCAVIHTFLTHRFRHIAHLLEERLAARSGLAASVSPDAPIRRVSATARLFHFLGEVEAVFGIWVLPLLALMAISLGPGVAMGYINERVHFTEPIFIVVIMAIAATRPVLNMAELGLGLLARLGGQTPAAWWLSILTAGPLLGSLITEPAAMTICASLLSRKIYARQPGTALSYATLGLLFVTVSAGGTLTHFAAPPVLMVAAAWGWDTGFMLTQFGWKAALGIVLSAGICYLPFRAELGRMRWAPGADAPAAREVPIPAWVSLGHVFFLALAVVLSHQPTLLVFAFLIFLAFVRITEDFQSNFVLAPAVMVGFFLAGLVVHGGLQQWWIAPLLGRLAEVPLMIGATILTSFNDNAAITYLCTLVPDLSDGMKYAAVAGAITGGGMTVIANAPNPAGQSILNHHFKDGIGATGLFVGALLPTVIIGACFLLFR